MPDANAMNLTRSKLNFQEHEHCRTQGLCFYCGPAGHITLSYPPKPFGEHIRTIQEASTTQPTQHASQDQGKA